MRHWLMKSEPHVYSIDDLARDWRTRWTGVRNFQARNTMAVDMQVGDLVLFYHSSADPPGVAGLARVSAPAAPDETQFDEKNADAFDPKATRAKPVWQCVEIEHVARARSFVPLEVLRGHKGLIGMELLRRGSRLSVQPVEARHFAIVAELAGLDV
jgi:predicted RNA-binding protein with PUA-like domain